LKAALDLDWDDPEAREQALRQMLQTLEGVEQWLANNPGLIKGLPNTEFQAKNPGARTTSPRFLVQGRL